MASARQERPNILVFQTDDHGQWASQPYGNRELRTPCMNWLAERGVRFDRAFTPCPVCSPARASFWTGKVPSAHGVHDWLLEGHTGDAACPHPGIAGQTTLPMHLQQAGYRTGISGKWHAGGDGEAQPGFDFWCSSLLGTNARNGRQKFDRNGETVEFHGNQGPFISEQAIGFLRDHCEADGGHPFFLYVGYTNTHTPYEGEPEQTVAHYQGGTFSDIPDEQYSSAHGKAVRPFTRSEHHADLAQYYAAVETIDTELGKVRDQLAALLSPEEFDNTLIIYSADHGHMNGHHGLHCKGNATIPCNFLDEAILVPLLFSWPAGGVQAGAVGERPVDHCDLFTTLLEAAGVSPLERVDDARLPGRSFLPLTRGEAIDWCKEQFCEYGPSRMVRTPTHKFIKRYHHANGAFGDELYDLSADPREATNVVADPANAPVIAALEAALETHFKAYEVAGKRGIDFETMPRHNQREPWRCLLDADL